MGTALVIALVLYRAIYKNIPISRFKEDMTYEITECRRGK
jgi:hypothetical protein